MAMNCRVYSRGSDSPRRVSASRSRAGRIRVTRHRGPISTVARWMRDDIHEWLWKALDRPMWILGTVCAAGLAAIAVRIGLVMIRVAVAR